MRGTAVLPLTDKQADYLHKVSAEHANVWLGACRLCHITDCRFYVDALLDLAIGGRATDLPRFSRSYPVPVLTVGQ